MSTDKTQKTRDLSLANFFDILQKEYIMCEFRARIYPASHKEYWLNIAGQKKEKIKDISNRNHSLPCIFSLKEIKDSLSKTLFPEIGPPLFIYRDEQQRSKIERWDYLNYYSKGASVKIYTSKDGFFESLGEIKKTNYENKTAIVLVNNEEKELSLTLLTRLL